ncbi:polysaccharide biosynthesis protein [Deferribacter desulfuricans SSM1]|uniref:Polysaccharide biosynthesis protein n=1 Tax=Deferribacter desulfuricans (strain DSM 14783 / JCM 11476 / NBRC 101012 / SSM1) TaxID=639282 RepID=D3PBA0_DEFDS|nr:oligosaccharide flippase family protein [Deferribacter desulfuricans]BAI79873.1 polysaccharide biosynthesis protein [Deferribacter desulfuricans SSM1]
MNLAYKILNSSLFKASGIYTIVSIINAVIPFFLLPVLTRYLSPEDYGIVAMFSLIVSIIGVFTGLSVHGAINRVYFEKDINFKEYVANCIFILFGSSVLTFLIVFFIRDFISNISGVPENWILIAVYVSFFQFLILSNLVIYQVRMKAKEYSFIQIGRSLLNVILTIFLVVIIGLKWEGRLSAQILATFIFGIFSFIILHKSWTEWKINKYYIKHALKFGVPLIPHTIGGMLIVATDRFVIMNTLGLKEAGIYTVGLQIGMIIQLFTDAFNKAYVPWLFEKLNQNDYKAKIKIVKFTYFYFVAIILFALVVGLLAPFLIKILVGKSFYESSSVVLWIALGGAFKGMYYMVTNYIFYSYKTYILTWITLFCGLINIPITFSLTKNFGIIGAGMSYSLVLFLFFILTFIISIKVYKMPWMLLFIRLRR